MASRTLLRLVTLAGLLAALLVVTPATRAETFSVTSLADGGSGSLRQAILDANAADGADTITFAVTGTIVLTSGQLTIDDDLTLDGPGAALLAVSGNESSRVLEITAGTTVTVDGLTIADGSAVFGAGILTAGALTLTDSVIRDNSAISGAGIYQPATGTLDMRRTTVRDNEAARDGGGLVVIGGGQTGTATIAESTFTGNEAENGGAVHQTRAPLTIQNSTFSGNEATEQAGAVYLFGGAVIVIRFVTFSGNTVAALGAAAALYYEAGAGGFFPTIVGTIFAGSSTHPNCVREGIVFSDGANLSSDRSCGLEGPTDLTDTDPLLAPLADNGGPTRTHLPSIISPALSLASPGPCSVTSDQRGLPRPHGSACDSGAVEFTARAPTLNLPENLTVEATGVTTTVNYLAGGADFRGSQVTPTCTPESDSAFALGVTTVSCTATDLLGASTTGTFTITVRDTTPPTLSVPANVTVRATGPSGTLVTFAASASDLVDPNPGVVCTPGSGSTFAIGTTTVTCTARDASGNQASASFAVTVAAPPVLTLPGNLVLSAQRALTRVEYVVSARDYAGQPLTPVCSPPSPSLFPLGTTTVTCTATDTLGGTSTGTFTITLVDRTPPALVVPGNLSIPATSPRGATASYRVSARDALDPAPVVGCAPVSGSVFPIGTTTVTCAASDASGNRATATFTVSVTTPRIASLSPSSLPRRSPDTVVTVSGSGFRPGAVVTVNGRQRATTFVSPSELRVLLPASDLTGDRSGVLRIQVVNPVAVTSNEVLLPLTLTPR